MPGGRSRGGSCRARATSAPTSTDPASIRAVEAMAGLFVEHEVERIRAGPGPVAVNEPAEWMNAVTVSGSGFWATADELAEVSATLQNIADRFEGRGEDPSKRPPGARPIRLLAVTTIDVEQEARHP